MARSHAELIVTVADARESISRTLRQFRSQEHAVPVVMGAHRKPEAVIVPYQQYQRLINSSTSSHSLDSIQSKSELLQKIAQLSNVERVFVFGDIVYKNTEFNGTIELLIEPSPSATYFDLVQFEIDMEQLFDCRVDVANAHQLDRDRLAHITKDAVLLS